MRPCREVLHCDLFAGKLVSDVFLLGVNQLSLGNPNTRGLCWILYEPLVPVG